MANFGRRTGSLKKLKESLAKGGNGSFIKFVPKNGELNIRFIQEPEEWISYTEHYDQVLKASFPCTQDTDCPGCASGERKSPRYLANAVNRDDKDRVIPLQLPKDLANRLVIRYEKWGTLTDRDIELSRSGEGLDTVYDFDAAAPDRKDVSKYKPMDLMKVLQDVFDSVFGEGSSDEDEDDDDEPKARRGRAANRSKTTRRSAVTRTDEDDEADEDDEEEDEVPSRRRPVSRPSRRAAADDDDEDEEPQPRRRRKPEPEPEPEDEDEDEEPEDYDLEELEAMTLGQLRSIARDMGIDPKGKSKEDLVDEIMDAPKF